MLTIFQVVRIKVCIEHPSSCSHLEIDTNTTLATDGIRVKT